MKIRGTDFALFYVSELARSVRFYRDILGLKQETLNEEYQWAEFNCGNLTLALKGGAKLSEVATGARLAFAVDDLATAHETLKARGVRILLPPQDHGRCRHMEVADPDGHVVILHRRADGTYGQSTSRALASLH